MYKPSRVTHRLGREGVVAGPFTWFDAEVELIVHGVAELLSLPSAEIRLVARDGVKGCISLDVTPEGADLHSGDVYLAGLRDHVYIPNSAKPRNRVGHSLTAIERVLSGRLGPASAGPMSATEVFAGYLLLDAWVGNTDRHAENWALTVRGGETRLASSFDHGSALAAGRDDDHLASVAVEKYANGAKARKFEDGHQVRLTDLALDAAQRWGAEWISALRDVDPDGVRDIVQAVPGLSEVRRTFVINVLAENRRRLIES